MTTQTQNRHVQNEWGGVDYHGPKGIARSTVEDEENVVYALTSSGVEVWKAVTPKHPRTIFDAAWLAAREYADLGALDQLAALQRDVLTALTDAEVDAEYWHSGGGIFGILFTIKRGTDAEATLFTTLDGDGAAWVKLDWSANDGELIGVIEVQVRPLNPSFGTVDDAATIAEALAGVWTRLSAS